MADQTRRRTTQRHIEVWRGDDVLVFPSSAVPVRQRLGVVVITHPSDGVRRA